MEKVRILEKYCKGCGICIEVCPNKILAIGDKSNEKGYFTAICLDQGKCISCALCAKVCPDVAIEVYK